MSEERRSDRYEEHRVVGVFNNVSNRNKPNPEDITAGLTGCITYDCPEEHELNYRQWYGDTLHKVARGSVSNDRHNRFRDGEGIRTSLLIRDVKHKDGSRFLYTLNSIYEVLS